MNILILFKSLIIILFTFNQQTVFLTPDNIFFSISKLYIVCVLTAKIKESGIYI